MPVDHSVSQAIRAHDAALNKLYFEHKETVEQLRHTLLTEILPNVVDELGLDNVARDWVEEWLQDDLSIFRTLKRHKFTKAFTLESLRTILTWRLTYLKSQDPSAFPPLPLHILPPHASDTLGRPILVLKLANLDTLQKDPREHILRSVEGLRLNLHNINSSSSSECPSARHHGDPVLQYILLVDMENASMRNFNLDLLTWYTRQVAPRYPGLFGTVIIINFSWTQSGIWSVIKLTLPESVHNRIFFPSRETLHDCISPTSLPQGEPYYSLRAKCHALPLSEYGGHLPFLSEIPNLLDAQDAVPTPSLSLSLTSLKEDDSGALLTSDPEEDTNATRTSRRKIASLAHISPRSRFNPFYGYPIGPSPYSLAPAALPYLRYGRRRKRDLLRTLAVLWWERWRSRVSWTSFLFLVFVCARWWWRQRWKGVFVIQGWPI